MVYADRTTLFTIMLPNEEAPSAQLGVDGAWAVFLKNDQFFEYFSSSSSRWRSLEFVSVMAVTNTMTVPNTPVVKTQATTNGGGDRRTPIMHSPMAMPYRKREAE